jgi:hypothetical protein
MWTEIVNQIAALSPRVLASVNPPADPESERRCLVASSSIWL